MDRTRQIIAEGQISSAVRRVEEHQAMAPDEPAIPELRRRLAEAALRKARQAAVLHLRGQHQTAIDDLEDALAGIPNHPMAHLYLGFAYYTRHLAGGNAQSESREQGLAELGTALGLDPEIEPAPRAVSPRLIDVLERLRRGETP